MFAWRKKPDRGFEWHKYVRTAVRRRREARRQRLVDAGRAAGHQVQAAGAALAAGSRAAGGAARNGVRAGAGAVGFGLLAAGSFLSHSLQQLARPVLDVVARPNVGGPLALAGSVALAAGIGRSHSVALDREAVTMLLIGAVLTMSLLPMLARSATWLPRPSARSAAAVVGLALLLGGAAWFASGGDLGKLASVGNLQPIGGAKPLEGRAYAIGAYALRVAGTEVKLGGIEAPESEQRCNRAGGRSWRCGAAAETALARLVNGRRVSCVLSGTDEVGRTLGQCSVGAKDVAAELVRQGHVFADGSLLARYASQEREARAAKAGLWSGEPERPAAYRAKLWEEAKRRAPEGCPIKGQVSGASRVYVLPWSPDYERARVQKARGERWFCSEQEAVAAGFKAAPRG